MLDIQKYNDSYKNQGNIFQIQKYNDSYKDQWDNFVKNSKNGVFFFLRDYIDFHSDKFEDYSLIFLKDNKPVGLMPANMNGDKVVSHAALTFGGIITSPKMKTSLMLQIFDSLKGHLKIEGFKKLLYKPVPHIYHLQPAEEDLYALFINNADMVSKETSSTLKIDDRIPCNLNRNKNIKKAKNNGIIVKRSYDFDTFMVLKEELSLKEYYIEPKYTAEEMEYLSRKFPENIKLFVAEQNGKMIDGMLIYESENVAYVEDQGFTKRGMELHASDLILDRVINHYYHGKKYFDFGISTGNNDFNLNKNLIEYKEGFGARSIVYDSYELDLG